MKVTQEGTVDRQTTLMIELETQEVEKHLDRAYRKVVQRLNVPGFRKGKAPRRIVEQFMGREGLLHEALDDMIPEVTGEAVEEQGLEVGDVPQVEIVEHDPVTIKATVPLVPRVDLGDYRSLRVDQDPVDVTDEQVDNVLERMVSDSTPWGPVERPVQYGDMVTLGFHAYIGEELAGDQHDVNYIPQEGNLAPAPGFSEALVGVGPGEEKEFTVAMPEDHPDANVAGKDIRFEVTVNEIKAKELPELNDEYAKGEGHDSLEALRSNVRGDIEAQAQRMADSRYQEKVMEALLEQVDVEIAPIMVGHRLDHVVEDYQENIQRRGANMEEYLQAIGKTPEELREDLRENALMRVKRSTVMEHLAEKEKIQVLPEDVEQELEQLTSGEQGESLRGVLDSSRGRESLGRSLWTQRVLERLVLIAKGEAPELEADPEAVVEEAATQALMEDAPADAPAEEAAAEANDAETADQPEEPKS